MSFPWASRRLITTIAAAAWLVAVAWGFVALARYDAQAGERATTPASWPTDAPIALDDSRLTLLLFAHPHCPCTRATLGELDRIVATSGDRLRAHVFFYKDPKFGEDWPHTDLWRHAAGIPGVDVFADPLGLTAERFGARTSGHVLVYEPIGELVFSGGITDGRGHAGDNAGETSIEQIARGYEPSCNATCVFGCSLVNDGAAQRTPRIP